MESPLTAPDFLVRFHLPQLVRIELPANDNLGANSHRPPAAPDGRPKEAPHNATIASLESASVGLGNEYLNANCSSSNNTSHNRLLLTSEKRSKWTYLEPQFVEPNLGSSRDDARNRHGLDCYDAGHLRKSQSASSLCDDPSVAENRDGPGMASLIVELPRVSLQSASRNNAKLRRPLVVGDDGDCEESLRRQVRSARDRRIVNYNQSTFSISNDKQFYLQEESTFNQNDSYHKPSNKQDNYKQKVNSNDSGTSARNSPGASIRLCPPSKRPIFSKLALNQPFLLYKARRKVEMSAYVMDRRNELNQRSGQPIYFPVEYSGWFSLTCDQNGNQFRSNRTNHALSTNVTSSSAGPTSRDQPALSSINLSQASSMFLPGGALRPLEYIGQVCESDAQVFLTRDQIAAYRLPTKLSQLTKLKNTNQLLALPLAINLAEKNYVTSQNAANSSSNDSKGNSSKSKASDNSSQSSSNNKDRPISDLVQTTIECGQVLMVCGIYEDVLPLIERNSAAHPQIHNNQHHQQAGQQQQHQQYNAYFQQQQQQQYNCNPYDLSPLASAIYERYNQAHQQSEYNPNTDQPVESADQKPKRRFNLTSWKKNQPAASNNLKSHEFPGQFALSPPLIYSGKIQEPQPTVLVSPAVAISSKSGRKESRRQQQQQAIIGRSGVVSGQRYARCIVLSDQTVDRLTGTLADLPLISNNQPISTAHFKEGKSTRDSAMNNQVENEPEVLIPLNQRGRFYLCATNQSILNELYNYTSTANANQRCQPGSPLSTGRVYRLSQIVYQLNMFKKLSTRHKSHQMGDTHRVVCADSNRDNVMRLPLPVQLIFGPRPPNFSPTMFGASSTMESYFELEENIGGHRLDCYLNKNNSIKQHAYNSIDKQREVCNCASHLISTSSGKSQPVGLFSAKLQLEQLIKRDVLLACTIKPDPLERLRLNMDSYHSEGLQQVAKNNKSPAKDKAIKYGATVAGRAGLSLHLLDDSGYSDDTFGCLSPEVAPGQSEKQQKQQAHVSSKMVGKSSFSRLQACRSLINLNGRRKQRPKIPTSMMPPGVNSAPKSLPTSDQLKKSPANSQFEAGLNYKDNDQLGDEIVLVEFDLSSENNNNLKFSRTFLEPSIPTANIPELVLSRVQYAQLNSAHWERQLKLSYETLAEDFETCERQMREIAMVESVRIGEQARKARLLEEAEQATLNIATADSALISQRDLLLSRCNSNSRDSKAKSKSKLIGSASPQSSCSPSEGSVDSSTQSSRRSSSGVSSSGDPHQTTRAHHLKASDSKNEAIQLPMAETRDSMISYLDPAAQPNPSRLLRLVQRVFPPFLQSQQNLIGPPPMTQNELVDKTKELDAQGESQAPMFNHDGTLMNAQKIHKMMSTRNVMNDGGDDDAKVNQQHLYESMNDAGQDNANDAGKRCHWIERRKRKNVTIRKRRDSKAASANTTINYSNDRADHNAMLGSVSNCVRSPMMNDDASRFLIDSPDHAGYDKAWWSLASVSDPIHGKQAGRRVENGRESPECSRMAHSLGQTNEANNRAHYDTINSTSMLPDRSLDGGRFSRSAMSESELSHDQMEPISIEICCDQFDSKVEDDDDEDDEDEDGEDDDEIARFGTESDSDSELEQVDGQDYRPLQIQVNSSAHYASPEQQQQQSKLIQGDDNRYRIPAAQKSSYIRNEEQAGENNNNNNNSQSLYHLCYESREQNNKAGKRPEASRGDGEEVIYANLINRGRVADRMERKVMQYRAQRAKGAGPAQRQSIELDGVI